MIKANIDANVGQTEACAVAIGRDSNGRVLFVGEREISTEGVDLDCVKGSSRKSATRDDGRNGGKQQQQQN